MKTCFTAALDIHNLVKCFSSAFSLYIHWKKNKQTLKVMIKWTDGTITRTSACIIRDTQTKIKYSISKYWNVKVPWWMSHISRFLMLIPAAHCSENKLQPETLCRHSVKCTPIAETTPVLHQYSAKWERNIIQYMNLNMTLIEPSIRSVHARNIPSSCTSFVMVFHIWFSSL